MALGNGNLSANSTCALLKTGLCNGSVLHDKDLNNDINTDVSEPETNNLFSSIILLLVTGIIILFNGMLLYCTVKNRKKEWVKSIQQIMYLILSDFIVGILLIPRNALVFMHSVGLSYSTCATISYMLISTQCVSFYHVMAVCIHRCRMARDILLPSCVDRYNYGRESLAIWVGVMLACLPPYLFWGRHGEIIYKCHVEYLFGPMDTGAKIYAFVLYMIPCITTNILYIFVVLKVKMSVRRVHVINTNSNAPINSDASVSQTAQANKKIIRTVGLLLVTFNANIACMAVIIGTLFEPGFTVPRIFQSFALMNNVCNPFIYMTASSTFKNEIYKIILKLKC